MSSTISSLLLMKKGLDSYTCMLLLSKLKENLISFGVFFIFVGRLKLTLTPPPPTNKKNNRKKETLGHDYSHSLFKDFDEKKNLKFNNFSCECLRRFHNSFKLNTIVILSKCYQLHNSLQSR